MSHICGSLIIFPQTIRKARIRISTDIIRCTRSQLFKKRLQLTGTKGAIQSD